MKNYPLLPLNHKKQWIAWNKTYLQEINHNIFSLWDYNNYFIPDYSEKKLAIVNDTIEASHLDYNEYFRALDPTAIMLNSTPTGLTMGAGFLFVSKARNESSTKYIYDINNYFIQPFGYASFYIFTYNSQGQLIAIYDQYAEETYGLNYTFSLFLYYPRFLLTQTQAKHDKVWILSAYLHNSEEKRGICAPNGVLWTDINQLKPMNFHFIVNDNDDFGNNYGEEVIIDTANYYSINLDEISIAQYTEVALEKGDTNIWPANIVARVI